MFSKRKTIVRWGKKKQKTLSLILFKSTELLVIGNTTIRWGLHRVIRGYIVYEYLYPPQRKKPKKLGDFFYPQKG